jgi:DNA polymerase III alpha subunit
MLRVRSGYSFRSAAGKLNDVMARLVEVGATAAPLTDRASTFGWVQWSKLAAKNNLKPVFGVELGVTASVNEKKPVVDHWTFIAQGSVTPINKLLELATQQFRY